MSHCTDRSTGRLLHAYELGILTETEHERFEEHLVQCESCGRALDRLEEPAALLTTGRRVRAAVSSALRGQASKVPLLQRWWRLLWPERSLLLRPAIPYLLLTVLATTLVTTFTWHRPEVREVQQAVHLSSVRAGTGIIDRGDDRTALLTFDFDAYEPGRECIVIITDMSDNVVYREDHFAAFDERGIGALSLSTWQMGPGDYQLTIKAADTDSTLQVHRFRLAR